jgi:hypothetical protein
MSEAEEKKLLELGRELSERLLRQPERHTSEALSQARQRALQKITARTQRAPDSGKWLPAAVAMGVATLGIVMLLRLWNGSELPTNADDHGAFMVKTLTTEDAPWDENPGMLENMEFTLWLDMAGPEDAG